MLSTAWMFEMASIVQFDRKWEINSREDYEKAMQELDDNEFTAEMSDDFWRWQKEIAEVRDQRAEVRYQAIKKGIITPDTDKYRTWRKEA